MVSEATAARLPNRATGNAKGDGLLLKWRKVVEGGPGPALIQVPPALNNAMAIDLVYQGENPLNETPGVTPGTQLSPPETAGGSCSTPNSHRYPLHPG